MASNLIAMASGLLVMANLSNGLQPINLIAMAPILQFYALAHLLRLVECPVPHFIIQSVVDIFGCLLLTVFLLFVIDLQNCPSVAKYQ